MKKHILVLLMLTGLILGGWLAKENRELLDLVLRPERPAENIYQRPIDMSEIDVGMETWQVKAVFGPPDKRDVVAAEKDIKRENWTYGNKCLNFTNGVLTSWQEQEEQE